MFNKEVADVLKELDTSVNGLNNSQAETRLHKYGFNELQGHKGVSPVKIFLTQFISPLVWLLIVAVGISLFLHETIDAIVIGIIILLNSVLGFIQEYKAEKSIEALKKLASPRATVIRNGKQIKIESKMVVPGDILVLETGDKAQADARLIEVHELKTAEGPLTGESQPIHKIVNILPAKVPLADRTNMVFAGTTMVNGRGLAVVTGTGMHSEIGKIATLIKESPEDQTPLQKKLQKLGIYLTLMVVVIAIVVFVAGLLTGKTASVMLLTAIALAVAAIPEGLPAVITLSLAIGVQRMIKRNALVRKLPSVETLGSVNVICTDKTGTLTHNEMTVTKLWANDKVYTVTGVGYKAKGKFFAGGKPVTPAGFKQLLNIGLLCNNARINAGQKTEVIGDPTEAALLVSAEKAGIKQGGLRTDELTFTSERKMMTTIYGSTSYTKGAPDILLKQCDRYVSNGKVQRLTREKRLLILKQNESFANEALRVLGFAYNSNVSNRNNSEKNMIFVGLQAMIDPPREEVKESIRKCHTAGIRVIMITGDHLTTAHAIALELGIPGKAVEGRNLHKINLTKEIDEIGIFARVNPEHKLQIVQALKAKNYIVAMTGDGVNDAPALKKADIGISMGLSGTEVAKEASDMILTDDNFATIVNAVEEGRGIFENIQKFVNYLLSSNLAEVLVIFLAMVLLAPIWGVGLPLTAIHILWINLVTDGLPALALGVDPHDKEIMSRKPRGAKENILSKGLMSRVIIFGILIGLATLIIFFLYRASPKAQTMAFTALVVFELARVQMIRENFHLPFYANKWLMGALGVSFALQLLVLYTPLSQFFEVVRIGLMDWLVIGGFLLVLFGANWIIQKKL